MTPLPHSPALLSRRALLSRAGTGLGMVALAGLLGEERMASAADAVNPLSPKPSHFPAKAKRIIHIYLNGGPSQVDTFDPKPALAKYAGKTLPTGNLTTERPTGAAFPSPFKFLQHGQSGLPISEIFPHLARHADELCVVRSMYANTPNHEQSMRLMNCGDERLTRPSYGSWLTYGLGSDNQNLPGFVVMCPGLPVADVNNWRSGFLPGIYQGTYLNTNRTQVDELIEHIRSVHNSLAGQRRQLDLLSKLNAGYSQPRAEDTALEARIESFELAFRMQQEAAEAFNLASEPKHILDLYGPGTQARQLLTARRLVERGVRVVQCYHGDVQPWDAHSKVGDNHRKLAGECDRGIGALITDLKQRGLLESTLIMIGGEFGRTPSVELPQPGTGTNGLGRDHNHWGFSVVLAGGGVRGGMAYGATDEFGFRAVENRVHVHDLHATMLHLMGFDHERLTFHYAGRDFRLTDVSGRIVREILA